MNARLGQISGAAAQGYSQQEPQTPSPLPASVDGLRSAVTRLDQTCGQLRDRLASVTAPAAPQTAGKDAALREVSACHCLMVDELDAERRRIQALTDALTDILQRLEV